VGQNQMHNARSAYQDISRLVMMSCHFLWNLRMSHTTESFFKFVPLLCSLVRAVAVAEVKWAACRRTPPLRLWRCGTVYWVYRTNCTWLSGFSWFWRFRCLRSRLLQHSQADSLEAFRRVWSCLVLVCSTSYTLHIQAPSREKQTLFAWCSEQSGLQGISRFCCWSSGNVESPVKDMRHWFMILHGPKPMAETLWPCFDRSLSTARSDNSVKQRCAVSTRQAKRAGAHSFNASRFEDFLECSMTQYSVWMIIIYGECRIPIDELFWGFPHFPIDFSSAQRQRIVNLAQSVGS
jgi:hypothetical protein